MAFGARLIDEYIERDLDIDATWEFVQTTVPHKLAEVTRLDSIAVHERHAPKHDRQVTNSDAVRTRTFTLRPTHLSMCNYVV